MQLTFAEFSAVVSQHFACEVADNESLAQAGFDSLDLYELLEVLGFWADFDLPADLVSPHTTMRDVFAFYQAHSAPP